MVKGHIVFALSARLCSRVCSQNRVRHIPLSFVAGFLNYLAQMIIITGRYAAYKSHIARLKDLQGHTTHMSFVHSVASDRDLSC